jgi:hypothetical protein
VLIQKKKKKKKKKDYKIEILFYHGYCAFDKIGPVRVVPSKDAIQPTAYRMSYFFQNIALYKLTWLTAGGIEQFFKSRSRLRMLKLLTPIARVFPSATNFSIAYRRKGKMLIRLCLKRIKELCQ